MGPKWIHSLTNLWLKGAFNSRSIAADVAKLAARVAKNEADHSVVDEIDMLRRATDRHMATLRKVPDIHLSASRG